VIASMDYHSPDHCSFDQAYDCGNERHLTDADATAGKRRYVNTFPPHTQFEVLADVLGQPTHPSEGAKFNPKIREAMKQASEKAVGDKDPSSVNVVFKAFNDAIDSFSAFPHVEFTGQTTYNVEKFTGAYGLREGMPTHCYNEAASYECFPTLQQLKAPDMTMIRMDHVLKDRFVKRAEKNKAPITQIIVTGLVFDYCVKETAMYTKKFVGERANVVIPLEFSRPILEGLEPNVGPLATEDWIVGHAKDMTNIGVEFAKSDGLAPA